MASTKVDLVPDSDDADGSTDWSIQTNMIGDDLHSALATTSTTRYIKSNTIGARNYFGFENLSFTPAGTPPIHWLQYYFTFGADLANEVFSLYVGIVDGGDSDNIIYNDTLTLTAPANTNKLESYTSPIFPYHSGTTAWSVDNINNLKVFLRLIDNDTGGSASTTIRINYFEYQIMTNNSDRATPSTYEAKKGIKIKRGTVGI